MIHCWSAMKATSPFLRSIEQSACGNKSSANMRRAAHAQRRIVRGSRAIADRISRYRGQRHDPGTVYLSRCEFNLTKTTSRVK